jgi:hypothetical protein
MFLDDEILAQVYIKTIESCSGINFTCLFRPDINTKTDAKDNENAEIIFDAFNEVCIKVYYIFIVEF